MPRYRHHSRIEKDPELWSNSVLGASAERAELTPEENSAFVMRHSALFTGSRADLRYRPHRLDHRCPEGLVGEDYPTRGAFRHRTSLMRGLAIGRFKELLADHKGSIDNKYA
jgi:hypothetical protein